MVWDGGQGRKGSFQGVPLIGSPLLRGPIRFNNRVSLKRIFQKTAKP